MLDSAKRKKQIYQLLSEPLPCRMQVVRHSMVPQLMPGDWLEIEPIGDRPPRVGEIFVYRRQGQWIVHRLLHRYKNWHLFKGDASNCVDPPVPAAAIFGRVTGLSSGSGMAFESLSIFKQIGLSLSWLKALVGGSPLLNRWKHCTPYYLDLAGCKVLLMLPPGLAGRLRLERLQRWRLDESAFDPWIVSFARVLKASPRTSDEFLSQSRDESIDIETSSFRARLKPSKRTAVLCLVENQLGDGLENFLRALLMLEAPNWSGVLLHSSAVVVDDEAYLFVGRSGSGKSTIAALSQQRQYRVLSDDLVGLKKVADRYVAVGLPFQGSHRLACANDGEYPIRRLFFLNQAETFNLKSLTPAIGLARLIAAVPFISQESSLSGWLMGFFSDFLKQREVQQLDFTKSEAFWDDLLEKESSLKSQP